MVIYFASLLSFSLLGLVWLGIRSERQKTERLLKEATRNLQVVAISKGTRRRI